MASRVNPVTRMAERRRATARYRTGAVAGKGRLYRWPRSTDRRSADPLLRYARQPDRQQGDTAVVPQATGQTGHRVGHPATDYNRFQDKMLTGTVSDLQLGLEC